MRRLPLVIQVTLDLPNITLPNVALVVVWATFVLWLVGAIVTVRGIRKQRPLEPAGDLDADADEPFVSVLVPARDEIGRVLDAAIRSLLNQSYKTYEVVAVDDRSIDGTLALLREFAEQDKRLRVIAGAELPAGWLGKPHAMQQAYDAAIGEWLLATDADCIFDPQAIRTAVAYARAGGYDALTIVPQVECVSFWERVFMPAFGWFMFVSRPVERVNDPRRRDAIGVGGFFLMRREPLARLGAWRAVRAEVAEDLRLAEMLKASGARLRVEYAPGLVRTRMQTNLREIWEGFTKNLYAGTHFRFWQAAAGGVAVLLFSVAPVFLFMACAVVSLAGGADAADAARLALPCGLIWAIQIVTFAIVNRASGVSMIYAPLAPLGHLLFVLILFNSTFKIVSGRGVKWKGRVLYDRTGVRPPSASGNPAPDV